MLVEYSSNNSGGGWWLSDANWRALEAAGWHVAWGGMYYCNSSGLLAPQKGKELCGLEKCPGHRKYENAEGAALDRYLGALAKDATKEFTTIKEAILEFERVTKQDVSDEGCNCCGPPHSFSWDEGYCSGEDCLQYLYENVPVSLREAVEQMNQ